MYITCIFFFISKDSDSFPKTIYLTKFLNSSFIYVLKYCNVHTCIVCLCMSVILVYFVCMYTVVGDLHMLVAVVWGFSCYIFLSLFFFTSENPHYKVVFKSFRVLSHYLVFSQCSLDLKQHKIDR